MEDKLNLINNEKDKVEARLKDAKQIEIRERELEVKEQDLDEKLDTIQREFDRLSKLKEENLQLKEEIDNKIYTYRQTISNHESSDLKTN